MRSGYRLSTHLASVCSFVEAIAPPNCFANALACAHCTLMSVGTRLLRDACHLSMAMLLRRSKITAVTDAITYSTSMPVTALSTIASALTTAITPETIDTTHIQR